MSLSPALLDHFEHPRGKGAFAAGALGVVAGQAGSMSQGAVVRFELKLGEGRIEAARFMAFGDAETIAAASMVTEWLPGRAVEEAYNVEVRRLVAALELPVERMIAALVVEDALRAALKEVIEPCQ